MQSIQQSCCSFSVGALSHPTRTAPPSTFHACCATIIFSTNSVTVPPFTPARVPISSVCGAEIVYDAANDPSSRRGCTAAACGRMSAAVAASSPPHQASFSHFSFAAKAICDLLNLLDLDKLLNRSHPAAIRLASISPTTSSANPRRVRHHDPRARPPALPLAHQHHLRPRDGHGRAAAEYGPAHTSDHPPPPRTRVTVPPAKLAQ